MPAHRENVTVLKPPQVSLSLTPAHESADAAQDQPAQEMVAEIDALRAALEAERLARRQAEQRLARVEATPRLDADLQRLVDERCLVWTADVTEVGGEALAWELQFPAPAAAMRFLQIEPSAGEMLGDAWHRARLPEDRAGADRHGNASVRRGQGYSQDFRYRTSDGSIRWLHEDVQVVTLVPCEQWRAVGVCTDITARKQAEEERAFILSSAPCILWSADVILGPDGKLVWNDRFFDVDAAQRLMPIAGKNGQEYIWAWHDARLPEDRERTYRAAEGYVRRGVDYTQQFRLRAPDGSLRWMQEDVRVIPIEPGEQWWLVAISTDITQRMLAEEERERHLREIESLNAQLQRAMTETHHRVKNNLQIIAALLEMYADSHEAAAPDATIRSLSEHVRSLAVIHDLLTDRAKNEPNAERLSARAVFGRLLPPIRATLPARKLEAHVKDLPVTPRQATALALITNELIANAVKHASGPIRLDLTESNGVARLVVADNGAGFAPDFDAARASNTGLEMVVTLSQWDLRGLVAFENGAEGGAQVIVEFPTTDS